MDLPTSEDSAVIRQLENAVSYHSVNSSLVWTIISTNLRSVRAMIQLVSQVSVLLNVTRDQTDGMLLAMLTLVNALVQWYAGGRMPMPFPRQSSIFH